MTTTGTRPLLPVLALLASTGLMVATTSAATAQSAPDPEALAMKECGACHMAYPPQLLPARSWHKLLATLDAHFGEVASLPEPTRSAIESILVENAADSPQNGDRWVMRGVPTGATPLRVTDMPFWNAIHGEIPEQVYLRPNIRHKGNCLACHQ